MRVADNGDEGGCREEADAWDCSELSDDGGVLGQRRELVLDGSDAVFELADFLADLGEHGSEGIRKARVCVLEGGPNGRDDPTSPDGDDDSELSEEAASGVDPCGSCGKPA